MATSLAKACVCRTKHMFILFAVRARLRASSASGDAAAFRRFTTTSVPRYDANQASPKWPAPSLLSQVFLMFSSIRFSKHSEERAIFDRLIHSVDI
jgi:hypothetical protein